MTTEKELPENYDEYISVRFAADQEPVRVPAGPKLTAENGWDPVFPENSRVFDVDGKCIGVLVSIDPDVIANSPGIQSWSKPGA